MKTLLVLDIMKRAIVTYKCCRVVSRSQYESMAVLTAQCFTDDEDDEDDSMLSVLAEILRAT